MTRPMNTLVCGEECRHQRKLEQTGDCGKWPKGATTVARLAEAAIAARPKPESRTNREAG
jgi:hypothetical protein